MFQCKINKRKYIIIQQAKNEYYIKAIRVTHNNLKRVINEHE